MDLFSVIEARHLATLVASAKSVSLHHNAYSAHAALIAGGFDQAPVLHRKVLQGWVKTADLREAETVSDALQPLTGSQFAGSAASVDDVLPALNSQGFCFTVGRCGIEGFITPSDLDRHAARSHFYVVVSGVEMRLSEVIRTIGISSEVIESRISSTPPGFGGPSLLERFLDARSRGQDTHPVEYLYLGDLIDLLREAGLIRSKSRLIRDLQAVQEIRNPVMHATQSLSRLGPKRLLDASNAARRALAATEPLLGSS